MRLTHRLGIGIGLCAVLSLPAAPPASAVSPHPWADVASSSFSVPAGSRCPFALSGTVLADDERIRTLETYDDGAPRTQEVVGRLVIRYRNEDSGTSVERNLTGTGIFTLRPDGSMERLTLQGGHFGAGLRAGDAGGPAFLVFTGAGHSVSFGIDGTRTVTYGSGPVENLCETLAG